MNRRRFALVALAPLAIATLATAADLPPAGDLALNQVGFTPNGPKRAVLRSASPTPVAWQLKDASGDIKAEGESTVFGDDRASGDQVHVIDFSGLEEVGDGWTLSAGGADSHPFRISPDVYAEVKRDALHYFYHNRSGVPIEAEYVGDPKWARPAGHAPQMATCFSGADERGTQWPGCDYTLDVTGGWYDAGDHGEYVVNGGISVWTLLNYWERAQKYAGGYAFPDGSMSIPEAGNGVDDLLDEARVEMEFLMAMQAPEGARLQVPEAGQPWNVETLKFREIDAGGMAHHKVHGRNWTPFPSAPHQDQTQRYLYFPSTAATLNLAAPAAQCARIWKDIDPAFAARCLAAAERAFAAARRNPDVMFRGAFGGGGGYGDRAVDDEFYWAAAELFITTGKAQYAEAMRAAPKFLGAPGEGEGATADIAWPRVGALGTLSLLLHPDGLSDAEAAKARANVIAAADAYMEDAKGEGYGIPFDREGYPWGSNGSVLNIALVLAVAYDLTDENAYRDVVVATLDYVLGRNPMDQSYVSGHGERPLLHPHHRFWANQEDPYYPPPAPGALSGGPNSTNMSDEVASELRGKCAPMKCYIDDAGAYTLNEVAINWNAPLVWVAAFLDQTAE